MILLIIYRYVLPKDNDVDWWTAFAFMLVPPLLLVGVSIALGMLGLNPLFALVCYLAYVLFPLYWFRSIEEYGWGSALKFTAIVPVVAIVVETALYIALGGS